MSVADRYATFANFGGGNQFLSSRPFIKSVIISECIKRRLPSKHYVYKMEVEWTNGTQSVVYRRYSMFFDFQVKLQELYSSICHTNPQFVEKVPHLPELPGKILFGRSQIHQVAEKRRVKIEEFCQQLVSLPAEISQTNLVMGFFNTWPDDTMLPSHIRSISASVSASSLENSPFSSSTLAAFPFSPTSPSPTTPGPQVSSSSLASEAIISHPDEMENLEQYRVLADYQRKDSHQVNLTAGQVVHVIEKHDTGWWMVMSEDEQGYAPAAYLEPMEEKNQDHLVDGTNSGEFEAMESYSAQNEDEVNFNAGDKVEVISKSMDGWWKIRCNGKVGVAPSALIRQKVDIPQQPSTDVIYESHKSIYEGLNIHKPPPRRNTIERNHKGPSPYDVPRVKPLLIKKPSDLEDEESVYAEPPLEFTSEDEEDPGYYRVPRPLQITNNPRNHPKVSGSPPRGSEGPSLPPRGSEGPSLQKQSSSSSVGGGGGGSKQRKLTSGSLPAHSNGPTSPVRRDSTQSTSSAPAFSSQAILLQTLEEDVDTIYTTIPDESPYELEPSPTARAESLSPLYQNMDDAKPESEGFKGSSDLSDLKVGPVVTSEPGSPVSPSGSNLSPEPHTPSSPPHHTNNKEKEGDYVDIDDHDEYVDPDELREGSSGETSNPISPTLYKPLPKPPLPTSDPPKKKPKMVHSVSQSSDIITEDEYIPMEPIYTEPPPEDSLQESSSISQPQQQKQPLADQQQQKQPKQQAPSSQGKQKKPQVHPQPYSKHKAMRDKVQISSPVLVDKKCLKRAKSLEDLLASNSSRESSPQRTGSPPGERKFGPGGRIGSPARVPILPPFPVGRGGGSDHVDGKGVMSAKKPIPGKLKAGRGKKAPNMELPSTPMKTSQQSEGSQQLLQPTTSPPRAPSPEHRTITHTISNPLLPPPRPTAPAQGNSLHLKTYVAVSAYNSRIEGCLSFQAGDKCVLLRKTRDGWWLVNIGGREGWTPEGFWKEETRNQNNTIARPPGPPPSIPPQQLPERKPRSHTVAADSYGSPAPDFTSSLEGSLEAGHPSSLASSVEVEKQSSGEREMATEGRKTTPPPPPPQSSKPGKRVPQPPPKPRPLPNAPWRKGGEKPAVPQKPTAVLPATAKPSPHRRSPSNPSPPLPRRQSVEQTPSPPPLAPRRVEQLEKSGSGADEYVMLEDARTKDISLDSCPWFVGKMERVQAEQFLMEHGRQREFLVRERTAKDGYYALSLRYHYSCKHFNIDPTPDGQFAIGTLIFPAIADIVYHYQNNSLFIHEGQHVTLSSPARRRTRGADARPHS